MREDYLNCLYAFQVHCISTGKSPGNLISEKHSQKIHRVEMSEEKREDPVCLGKWQQGR